MNKIIKEIDSLDDIEFELDKFTEYDHTKAVTRKSQHYVNNKKLYQEFLVYHDIVREAITTEDDDPEETSFKELIALAAVRGLKIPRPKSNIIGAAILQIATRSCNNFNFVRYTNAWKEELIGNAVEKCVLRCHSFDPHYVTNTGEPPSAFSYLTQTCINAFKEQIKREKKQTYIKYKSIDGARGFMADMDDNIDSEDLEMFTDQAFDDRLKFIDDYETRNFTKTKKQRQQEHFIGLFGEDDIEIFETED